MIVSLSAHAIPTRRALPRETDRAVRGPEAWPASPRARCRGRTRRGRRCSGCSDQFGRQPPRLPARTPTRSCSATPPRHPAERVGAPSRSRCRPSRISSGLGASSAAGWKIVYEPAAVVYHSHDESPRAQARRLIDISRVADADGRVPHRDGGRPARPPGSSSATREPILGLEEPLAAQAGLRRRRRCRWPGTTFSTSHAAEPRPSDGGKTPSSEGLRVRRRDTSRSRRRTPRS